MNDRFMFERHCFMLQFTAFETDKSVGQCILLFRRDILFNNLNQIRQRHYGTADNKVERSFLLFCTGMAESHIFQSDGICHFGCYTCFFADSSPEGFRFRRRSTEATRPRRRLSSRCIRRSATRRICMPLSIRCRGPGGSTGR